MMEDSEKSRFLSISFPWSRAREADAKVTKIAVAIKVRDAGSSK